MKKCLDTEIIKENTEVEHLSCSVYSILYRNDFIKTKALILAKKCKNKLRTKPGLPAHRT